MLTPCSIATSGQPGAHSNRAWHDACRTLFIDTVAGRVCIAHEATHEATQRPMPRRISTRLDPVRAPVALYSAPWMQRPGYTPRLFFVFVLIRAVAMLCIGQNILDLSASRSIPPKAAGRALEASHMFTSRLGQMTCMTFGTCPPMTHGRAVDHLEFFFF